MADTPAMPLALTFIVYLRCLGNAFVYDDNEMIVLNRFIGDWAMLWKSLVNDSWWFRNPLRLPQSAYYRPLQDVWLAVNDHLFGLSPPGWHLASVIVHLIAVWLVFAIARELTTQRWTPAFAASFFGVLPIHAQAVVWPTAIPLPMSALFEMAALLCFIRREPRRHMAFAILFYAFALLSHESAVVFPAILAAYVVMFAPEAEQRTRLRDRLRRAAFETWPFFAEVGIYLAVRMLVLGFISRQNITNPMTAAQAILTLPSVLGVYALLLAAPWFAGPVHPVRVVSSPWSRDFVLPAVALGGITAAFLLGLWSSPRRKLYLFCGLWLAASLVPVLNLQAFSPLALVEDRYLYFGSAPWCVMFAELIVGAIADAELPLASVAAAGATVALVYTAILFHVEGFWHDEVVLFSTCTQMSPNSTLCHDRLGLALKQRGDLRQAENEFLIAQQLSPDDGANLYNLALVRSQIGDTTQAIADMKRALHLLPDAPAGAWVELAKIADLAGAGTERDDALARAAKLPGGAQAVETGRAELMLIHHDYAGAENLMRGATSRSPGDADSWTLLGSALADQGKDREALDAYRHALRLRPSADLRLAVTTLQLRIGQAGDGNVLDLQHRQKEN